MKSLWTRKSRNSLSRKMGLCPRYSLTGGLMLAALALAAPSANAINHPPFVSWIPDQRIMSGGFATQYFRIFDYDQLGFSITTQSTNGTWYPYTNVTISACTSQDTGCAQDGTGYKAVFANPTSDGVTTIIIGASQTGTGLTGYTSFTLRRASTNPNNPPPSIGSLPNYAIQLPSSTGQAVYQTSFVIGDLDANGNEDIAMMSPLSFTWSSTNTQILSSSSITFAYANVGDPRSYVLTATTNAGAIGVATVTINLTDPNLAVTSTSFVLQVVATANHPPSITNPTGNTIGTSFEEQILTGYTDHHFNVADSGGTPGDQLKVSAFSSNTKLVPNDFQNNLVVTQPDSSGAGSVRITPVLPLPSPGVPQASTITLSVTDDAYTRQTTFLYVMRTTSLVAPFSRADGVYALRPPDVLTLQTNPFLNGTSYKVLSGISLNRRRVILYGTHLTVKSIPCPAGRISS